MQRDPGSFRDPSGYIYHADDGTVLRVIHTAGRQDFEGLTQSGLYDELAADSLLVSHKDVSKAYANEIKEAYKIIKPQQVPIISYPYEWSFSQYKDAALATLEIHRRALEKNLTLKDASAYNVQFVEGRPIFIDTLSFEAYEEGSPWIAYRQFCQHFLAPLALMAYTDVSLNKLMRIYIDGVPLGLAAKLLPARARIRPSILAHIVAHARSQAQHEAAADETLQKIRRASLSKTRHLALIQNLANAIKSLPSAKKATEWGEYYTFTNYSKTAFKAKENLVLDLARKSKPKMIWDMGANDGSFSRVVATLGAPVVSFDIDPNAVEKNYLTVKHQKEINILPLVLDLTNPSPSLGWANRERKSLIERGPADLVLSLALIHHLAISNNVPLSELAEFFASIGHYLIMEFVPKGDSKVDKLLATREDIFPDYHIEGFEAAFSSRFQVIAKHPVQGSKRTMYLLKSSRT
jgi:2-polyprenyl-3-methyl-5-hydroxy-6-metoxy-1,4-benzoquinol methylase